MYRPSLPEVRATGFSSTFLEGGFAAFTSLPDRSAALNELVAWFPEHGIEIKSFAPLLLDFPAEFGDEPVLLCWLEGETELGWYHRLDCGFAGRRPIPRNG